MAEWLSEVWLKEVAAQAGARPQVSGANGTVSVAITGAPGGEVSYHWSYRDGLPGDGGVGSVPDASLLLTIAYSDAQAVASGEVEPSVAFMRGRLKASGDGGLLLGVLRSTATDNYRDFRQRVVGDGVLTTVASRTQTDAPPGTAPGRQARRSTPGRKPRTPPTAGGTSRSG